MRYILLGSQGTKKKRKKEKEMKIGYLRSSLGGHLKLFFIFDYNDQLDMLMSLSLLG